MTKEYGQALYVIRTLAEEFEMDEKKITQLAAVQIMVEDNLRDCARMNGWELVEAYEKAEEKIINNPHLLDASYRDDYDELASRIGDILGVPRMLIRYQENIRRMIVLPYRFLAMEDDELKATVEAVLADTEDTLEMFTDEERSEIVEMEYEDYMEDFADAYLAVENYVTSEPYGGAFASWDAYYDFIK